MWGRAGVTWPTVLHTGPSRGRHTQGSKGQPCPARPQMTVPHLRAEEGPRPPLGRTPGSTPGRSKPRGSLGAGPALRGPGLSAPPGLGPGRQRAGDQGPPRAPAPSTSCPPRPRGAVPSRQVGSPRLRDRNSLAQGHTQRGWDWSPGPTLLTTGPCCPPSPAHSQHLFFSVSASASSQAWILESFSLSHLQNQVWGWWWRGSPGGLQSCSRPVPE